MAQARSKAKKVAARRKAAPTAMASGLAAVARPVLTGSIIVAGIVALAFASLEVRVAAAHRMLPPPGQPAVVFEWPRQNPADPASPSWLPDAYQAEITALAERALASNAHPLSPEPLAHLAVALANSGWFEDDPFPVLRRDGSGSVVVEAQWRLPAAVVRVGADDHLVSWSGRAMPLTYPAGQSSQRVIHGVRLLPGGSGAARFSQVWPGEGVPAALKLLEMLAAAGLSGEVRGIDTSRLADDRSLEIITKADRRVIWGSPPGEFRAGEASDVVRINRLIQMVQNYGAIDAGKPSVRINGPKLIIDVREGADLPLTP